MNLLNIDCCVFFVEVIGVFGLFCMCIILMFEVLNLLINIDDFWNFKILCIGVFEKMNNYWIDYKSRNKVKFCKYW